MSYVEIHADAIAMLYQKKGLVIFDTRDAVSYQAGHLPGAVPISDDAIGQLIVGRKRNNPVLVYCYHGNSSRDICQLLSGMGFAEVYNLSGGWKALEQDNQLSNTMMGYSIA